MRINRTRARLIFLAKELNRYDVLVTDTNLELIIPDESAFRISMDFAKWLDRVYSVMDNGDRINEEQKAIEYFKHVI